jgi:uncharacterized protein (DUF849 family)
MTMAGGLMLMVAPNGARKTTTDHPALPLEPGQIALEAERCLSAGAAVLHLHVRDDRGGHSLDAGRYERAMAAVRERVGDELVLQMTTEAVGLYTPPEQMAAVKTVRPEAVSLALREIWPDAAPDEAAAAFLLWLKKARIWPQFILYDAGDVRRLRDLNARGLIPFEKPWLLFVLGRYSGGSSEPADLEPFLAELAPLDWPWAVCAFGPREAACMELAARRGGHMRVGFENNLHLPDGTLAPDNAALVGLAAKAARDAGRHLFSAAEIRALTATT